MIEQRHDTVNEGNSTVAKFTGSFGSVNLHFDAFNSDNNDVEVAGFAIDEAALELLEEAHEGEGHEDGEHEEEEITNSKGYIANSDAEAKGYTVGTSISDEKGFIGFSVSSMDNEYGLPGGTHGHHEEEHGEDDEEEGEEFVRIDMEQTRYDIKGEYRFDNSFIERLQASVNYTDYEHAELEIEPDGTSVIGTKFSNEGYAARLTISHAPIG
jgi:iron complex outermembrane receptor protein